MSFFGKLFGKRPDPVVEKISPPVDSYLVDGRHTYQLAHEKKDDLETMLRCCDAEIRKMQKTKLVAAPFYFERAAILLRKAKRYSEEISVCNRYISAVDSFYARHGRPGAADVRNGPRFPELVKRIEKARALLNRQAKEGPD